LVVSDAGDETGNKTKMDLNLYQPSINDNLILFTTLSASNAVNSYVFGRNDDEIDSDPVAATTQFVSGMDRRRKIKMRISIMTEPVSRSQAFYISCIRLPYLSTALIRHERFSRPPTAVVVNDATAGTEVWHVLAAKRGYEAKDAAKIDGIQLGSKYVQKDVLIVRGNVPAGFISFLSNSCVRTPDTIVQLLHLLHPRLGVRTDPVCFALK
jgi:Nucleopolyhedrovirus protein of unknown function (DUF884)